AGDNSSQYSFATSNRTFTVDTTAPQWSDNSTTSTLAGTYIEHRVRWTDVGLSGYIFEFDNGTGTFANDSFVVMTGTNNWSNVTKYVNETVGSTIRWRVYANDTASPTHWNSTDIFTYNTTSVQWLTGWGFRKEITIQDAYVDSNLRDFPIYVYINADADFHEALATGYDIRFTQSDGTTLLKYERENWTGGDGGAGTGHFWVKVPSILASGGATIYCYYGKADAEDGEDAVNVWDANFKAVYHLKDLNDSTGVYALTASGTP
ncbi:unnamed protein product, partial [marine sediment metagenome]